MLHESSSLLALFLQSPTSQFDVQMRPSGLDASQFPSNVWKICGSVLNIGNGLWPEDATRGLFVRGIVLNDSVCGKQRPFACRSVELGEPE